MELQAKYQQMSGYIKKPGFKTYPNAFPKELIDEFIKETGVKGILCNEVGSGTEILKRFGEEHVKTGYPIIYTSADGINWNQRSSPFGSTHVRNVTYGGGKFVAVGDSGKIATSIDGITWALSESPIITNLYDVVYGASKFVAVGSSGKVITSPTGL